MFIGKCTKTAKKAIIIFYLEWKCDFFPNEWNSVDCRDSLQYPSSKHTRHFNAHSSRETILPPLFVFKKREKRNEMIARLKRK